MDFQRLTLTDISEEKVGIPNGHESRRWRTNPICSQEGNEAQASAVFTSASVIGRAGEFAIFLADIGY
jgi:hypothetical protein